MRSINRKKERVAEATLLPLLDYDPGEGVLRWRANQGRGRKGKVAGTIDRYGHRWITFNATRFAVHRLIYFLEHGTWPKGVVDHIDGDRDNNRPENLRDVSQEINTRNREKRGLGVYRSRSGLWYAKASNRHLGTFGTKAEAIAARREAEKELGYI